MSTSAERKTIILGLGVTGLSCLRHLYGSEALMLVDTRAAPPHLETVVREFPDVERVCGNLDPRVLVGASRIIVSPGVPLDSCVLAPARESGVPFESDIGLFLDAATAPVIGITGTNGKSTVTALLGELLEAAGSRVGVGGNIGVPALQLLGGDHDLYVLELSSFQLERLGDQAVEIAAVLNVSPDHMDRYADLDAYAASKRRVFRGARVGVYNRADPRTRPQEGPAGRVSVGLDTPGPGQWGVLNRKGIEYLGRDDDPIAATGSLRMRGRHNLFNALAALALIDAAGIDVQPTSAVADALVAFGGLEHRCQTVAESRGVAFINDSKATNPGATIAALEGLDQGRPNILLIAGGDAKGADLDALGAGVADRVKLALLLGKDAARLERALSGGCPVARAADLEEAVRRAWAEAAPGDVVLLSPACASLDMFDSFEARGRAFVDVVVELIS